MRLFGRRQAKQEQAQPAGEVEESLASPDVTPATAVPEPAIEDPSSPSLPGGVGDRVGDIRASRTLVKSVPELEQLVSTDPRLRSEGVEVTMARKGFGTLVAIAARPPSGLGREDLERLLDELAEPQKRPFSNV